MSLKSQRQIQTELLSALIASLGLNDVNPGSVIDSLTNAIAQQDFSLYYRIAQLSRLNNIDSLTGEDLELKAFEFGLEKKPAQKAIGLVSILRPEGFVKVSSQIYAGTSSPIAGDLELNVNDASSVLYGTSGTLIVGRGTNNEEEVTYSVAPTNNINFFTFTLDSALLNDHGSNETVILKQGNTETIAAGTIVRVLANGARSEILFELIEDAELLAGELEVANVEVRSILPGIKGNIPILAISGNQGFSSPPFPGARVQNNSKFTTGQNQESDDELRDRIKAAGDSLTKGVKNAIQTAIVGLVDPDTAKRIVSANIVLPLDNESVKIYLDDGTGLEPTFEKVGVEIIRQESTGGEDRFQLVNFPLTKAFVETNNSEPYNLSAAPLTLNLEVGGIQETLTFNLVDFRFPAAASASEIVEKINDSSFLIEARTSQGGKNVVITSKEETNENIQVLGGTVNDILGFPLEEKRTLNLYKNNQLLEKDGRTAILDSQNEGAYNLDALGAYPHTLMFIVDGKANSPLRAEIDISDVLDPAAVTAQEVANVINRDVPGLTATVINNGAKVRLESNVKLSSLSKLECTGGTANPAVSFPTTEVVGVNRDYFINKELGLVELVTPLVLGDTLSAGSNLTRGYVEATIPENYSPLAAQVLSIVVDGNIYNIPFDGASRTAVQTAEFLNNSALEGATAEVFERLGQNYIRIRTNTYGAGGSIEILPFPASTALASFGFTTDVSFESIQSNTAFKRSVNSGPFAFAENDNLIVILDQDSTNASYNINMSFQDSVSAAVDATDFTSDNLNSRFLNDDEINGYSLIFTSGPNTYTGTIESVTFISGTTYRYEFVSAPTGFSNVVVGDQLKASGLTNSQNNGNFIITAKGAKSVDVLNPIGVQNLTQAGTGLLCEKRNITNYNAVTGELTATPTSFTTTPVVGNTFVIVPRTVENVVSYLQNKKITPLSTRASIEAAEEGDKLQISSIAGGSEGAVLIPGGRANNRLGFTTQISVGNEAYSYYTGLLSLAHKTIYGDDEDLVAFPGVGAAGINFELLAPTVKEIFVSLNVTLRDNFVLSSLENEIKSRVTGYINNLKVSEDVILERIRAAVIAIPGVLDVSLSEPTSNIAIADNELARISQNNILVG